MLGGLGLALTALLLLTAIADRDPVHREILAGFLIVFGSLSLVYFIPSFVGGLGLLKGLPWARALIWAEAALLAPMLPLGTLLAGLSLWALLPRKGEAAPEGWDFLAFERVLARGVRPAIIALAAVATLGAMVGLGYLFRDQIEALDPQPKQELTPLPDFDSLPRPRP